MDRHYYTYMLASRRNGTLYTGVTGDLFRRMGQHRAGLFEGFAKRYGVTMLVWYEVHETPTAAIAREKRIKRWHRAWKIALIESKNPLWHDLTENLMQELPWA
jgi:putative endonuclease